MKTLLSIGVGLIAWVLSSMLFERLGYKVSSTVGPAIIIGIAVFLILISL